jgi:hypothetical protein
MPLLLFLLLLLINTNVYANDFYISTAYNTLSFIQTISISGVYTADTWNNVLTPQIEQLTNTNKTWVLQVTYMSSTSNDIAIWTQLQLIAQNLYLLQQLPLHIQFIFSNKWINNANSLVQLSNMLHTAFQYIVLPIAIGFSSTWTNTPIPNNIIQWWINNKFDVLLVSAEAYASNPSRLLSHTSIFTNSFSNVHLATSLTDPKFPNSIYQTFTDWIQFLISNHVVSISMHTTVATTFYVDTITYTNIVPSTWIYQYILGQWTRLIVYIQDNNNNEELWIRKHGDNTWNLFHCYNNMCEYTAWVQNCIDNNNSNNRIMIDIESSTTSKTYILQCNSRSYIT